MKDAHLNSSPRVGPPNKFGQQPVRAYPFAPDTAALRRVRAATAGLGSASGFGSAAPRNGLGLGSTSGLDSTSGLGSTSDHNSRKASEAEKRFRGTFNNSAAPRSKAHCVGPAADDIAEVLITEQELETRIAELGAQISADYEGKDPLLVGVLCGVFIFMADLVRTITIPISVDFIGITRYGPSTRTQGVVRFTKDLETNIQGRHVLFVEDVIDTGLTLRYILRSLETREPASLRVCVLFNKPRTRLFDLDISYTGFMLPDEFVVGYGLDYDERYRNLPFVGVLKDSAITRRRLPVGAQT